MYSADTTVRKQPYSFKVVHVPVVSNSVQHSPALEFIWKNGDFEWTFNAIISTTWVVPVDELTGCGPQLVGLQIMKKPRHEIVKFSDPDMNGMWLLKNGLHGPE